MKELEIEFRKICKSMLIYAYRDDSENYTGFDGYVPYARDLLHLIETHPQNKIQFIKLFIKLWENKEIDHDFIAICMHKLRWVEIKNYFSICHSQAIKENNWRAEPLIGDIVNSFDDDWEDAKDFYGSLFTS